MNRLAIFLTLACVSSLVAVNLIDFSHSEPDRASPIQNANFHDEYVSYFCFKNTFDTAIVKLRRGDIQLKDACIQVEVAAHRWHPKYLGNLHHSEQGKTDRERITRNLIGHLRMSEDLYPGCPLRVQALEAQFRALSARFLSDEFAPSGHAMENEG